jgi:hypothetical protein
MGVQQANMRRSDHDVSNRVRTTDTADVAAEILRLHHGLYNGSPSTSLEHAFADIAQLYRGEHADYLPCDTAYHDIQHVLDVTLAMARLMDGYERSRRNGSPPLDAASFALGIVTALYHDFGYLRRRSDRRHRFGAEYTLTHVSRGARYLHRYLPRLGLRRYASVGATLVHYTGYERPAETIEVNDTLQRRIGHMLGTADIIAQMSDRCYLEKCRDRLYPEFVAGGVARTLFRSGAELVRNTPGFYLNATKRLDLQLARAYEYAGRHFGGQNLYLEEIHKNVRHARLVADAERDELLRRTPPSTRLAANQ